MGSAFDIMEAGNAPRAVFLDYPLGHTTGKPDDPNDQYAVTRAGLEAFATIGAPGGIVTLPNRWQADETWKATTMDVSRGDERQPRDESPRWQHDDDRIAAEAALR